MHLKLTIDPSRLLAHLIQQPDITRYLNREIYEHLSVAEQQVMGAVAIFGDYPDTRDAIEAVIDRGSVLPDLTRLVDRGLLSVMEGPEGNIYSQHQIIQSFYYEIVGRKRKELHRQAALYYFTGA